MAQTLLIPFARGSECWAAAEPSSECWEGAPASHRPRAQIQDCSRAPAAHIHPLDQEPPGGRVQDTLNPACGNLRLREPLQK